MVFPVLLDIQALSEDNTLISEKIWEFGDSKRMSLAGLTSVLFNFTDTQWDKNKNEKIEINIELKLKYLKCCVFINKLSELQSKFKVWQESSQDFVMVYRSHDLPKDWKVRNSL